jgi:hypothetical protein
MIRDGYGSARPWFPNVTVTAKTSNQCDAHRGVNGEPVPDAKPAGELYEVSAELGLQPLRSIGYTLSANQTALVDITMRPAGSTIGIRRGRECAPLNTIMLKSGYSIENAPELPITTDRDISAYAFSPGVSQPGAGQTAFLQVRTKTVFS